MTALHHAVVGLSQLLSDLLRIFQVSVAPKPLPATKVRSAYERPATVLMRLFAMKELRAQSSSAIITLQRSECTPHHLGSSPLLLSGRLS
jgi:hypothetical protein